MRFFVCLSFLLILGFAFPRVSLAGYDGPLTKREVDHFLEVGYPLGNIASEMEKEGKRSFLVPRSDNIATYVMNMEDENIAELKANHPEYYAKASKVVKNFTVLDGDIEGSAYRPFNSLEEWAQTADRVLIAYFAINRGNDGESAETIDKKKELAEKMKLLPPGFMDMLPEEGRKKLEDAVGAEDRLNEVSSEDILVVKDSKERIGMFLFEHINRRSLK